MKDALEFIIKGIVKHPEDVRVSRSDEKTPDSPPSELYDLRLHVEDVGQVIGKDGRTIKSINILLNALAGQKEEKFILRVQR
ncbi:MAG TPA: KH domain-containing protein [Thermotogota bacterium]|nr:KH domain-containing protein [Thermotogota bacterium]NLH19028.1 KH domain-containing protein [Thermotogaceae bacterium]HNW46275.1 KH domain-containing protein [Thermotogota bacterium]HNY82308.1 KH domain-containing protein [Thermotogota bacterium]HOD90395.1 KH domain-containing protein [Thermotogota bacterium]